MYDTAERSRRVLAAHIAARLVRVWGGAPPAAHPAAPSTTLSFGEGDFGGFLAAAASSAAQRSARLHELQDAYDEKKRTPGTPDIIRATARSTGKSQCTASQDAQGVRLDPVAQPVCYDDPTCVPDFDPPIKQTAFYPSDAYHAVTKAHVLAPPKAEPDQ